MKKLQLNVLSVGEIKRIAKNFYGIKSAYRMTKQALIDKIEHIREVASQMEQEQVALTQMENPQELIPVVTLSNIVDINDNITRVPSELLGVSKTETIRKLLVAGWDRTLIASVMACRYQMVREIDIKTKAETRTKIRNEIQTHLDSLTAEKIN